MNGTNSKFFRWENKHMFISIKFSFIFFILFLFSVPVFLKKHEFKKHEAENAKILRNILRNIGRLTLRNTHVKKRNYS